jgi:1,2-diacylglycerol 3-alpha-glucosyltransferase
MIRASMAEHDRRPTRVLLACSGVGHAMRGFETFAIECHAALRADERVRPVLLRGRGPAGAAERLAPTFSRESRVARLLGRAARRDGYFAEQMAYAVAAMPALARERPDVVLFSDWALGVALGGLRTLARARYRLLLCNGAPGPPPYPAAFDHIQQLTPAYHEIEPELRVLPEGERAALRERLGLPRSGELLLSVAALNRWHKRLDYVIEEVAALDRPPHLVILGQREDETPGLLDLAASRLGSSGFTARTVPPDQVGDYYRCADAFVLGSIYEAFGRVLLEALARGLPTLCHDSETTRFVTGAHGVRADLTRRGALTTMLAGLRTDGFRDERRRAQHSFVRDNFRWEALLPRYIDMIERCAAG